MPENSGPLAAVLRSFLQQRGLAVRVEQTAGVLQSWPRVVGEAVAAATTPLSVAADGTLLVGVRSSAWMNELSLMERDLLDALNRVNTSEPIRRIRWQLVP